MSDYVPVACAFHESLEFAVLRGQRLRLRYVGDAAEVVEERVLPLDVETREGAEWLTFRSQSGATVRLRLDRIQHAEPV